MRFWDQSILQGSKSEKEAVVVKSVFWDQSILQGSKSDHTTIQVSVLF